MIQTRYGNEVTILRVEEGTPENPEWLLVRREEDGKRYEVHISDLRAPGGLTEIIETAKATAA